MTMPSALRAKQYRNFVLRILLILLALDAVVLVNQACRGTRSGLTEPQLTAALRDDASPAQVQGGLIQLRSRLALKQTIEPWLQQVVRLSKHPDPNVRHAVADFMAADPQNPVFRETLHRMLETDIPLVCNAAALSLASFEDNYGHELIVNMLKPVVIMAPNPGHVRALSSSGKSVEPGAVIFRIEASSGETPILAPISGKTRLEVATGDMVSGGSRLAVIEPSPEQLKSALQALQSVGKVHDIPQVTVVANNDAYPSDLRDFARSTAQKISERSR